MRNVFKLGALFFVLLVICAAPAVHAIEAGRGSGVEHPSFGGGEGPSLLMVLLIIGGLYVVGGLVWAFLQETDVGQKIFRLGFGGLFGAWLGMLVASVLDWIFNLRPNWNELATHDIVFIVVGAIGLGTLSVAGKR